jgi:sigma-B regulation protein RsbU (phosphoserine phosphatase)
VFYAVASMTGSMVAALIVDATLLPGFLRGGQAIGRLLMFSAIFCGLFLGIALARNFYREAMEKAKSEQELELARRIQRSFLLSSFPERPRLEVHAVNVSSRQVSGDFYDVVGAGDDAFLVAIADVAGKGVPAALLSSMLQASLRTQANSIASVAEILSNINSLVYRATAVHQFATFFIARVEHETLHMTFSNAGHNYPIVVRNSGEPLFLERGGLLLGIQDGAAYEEGRLPLHSGDLMVLYTDGVSEATNRDGEFYGDERLCELVRGLASDLTAREVTERILEALRDFLDGEEPRDDMTLMVVRVLEPDRSPHSPSSRPAPGEAEPVPGPSTTLARVGGPQSGSRR